MEKIVYDIRWSYQLDDKFINDFIHVCSTVFNIELIKQEFERKFIKNIYGPSVLVVVYIDDIPSAARALWRNDLDGQEAYQPGDTCVMENCRGKGIFSMMTKKSIAFLSDDAIIYNFPNSNSYPSYIKMGWKLVHDYRMKLLCSYSEYLKEHPIMMDKEYAKWWIEGRSLAYIKRGRHYFLVCKDRRPLCYRVISEVDREIAIQFPRKSYGLFFYKSIHSSWYSKRFAANHVVSRSNDIEYIPTWKIDAI